jgi:hypothetical protein
MAKNIFVEFSGAIGPADLELTCQGYSIGRWIDEDGGGCHDVLEVDTHGRLRSPRSPRLRR